MTAKTAFMHYRTFNDNGMPDCKGGATVAIQPMTDNKVLVSIARCNSKDVFSKERGRTIALGRMRSYMAGKEIPTVFEVDVPEGFTMKAAVNAVLSPEMSEAGLL
jgi:hypothetical protein